MATQTATTNKRKKVDHPDGSAPVQTRAELDAQADGINSSFGKNPGMLKQYKATRDAAVKWWHRSVRDYRQSRAHPDIATEMLNLEPDPNEENPAFFNVYDAPEAEDALTTKMVGSPQAARYYLTFKCVTEGKGISTADQINAGLKHWFSEK